MGHRLSHRSQVAGRAEISDSASSGSSLHAESDAGRWSAQQLRKPPGSGSETVRLLLSAGQAPRMFVVAAMALRRLRWSMRSDGPTEKAMRSCHQRSLDACRWTLSHTESGVHSPGRAWKSRPQNLGARACCRAGKSFALPPRTFFSMRTENRMPQTRDPTPHDEVPVKALRHSWDTMWDSSLYTVVTLAL